MGMLTVTACDRLQPDLARKHANPGVNGYRYTLVYVSVTINVKC